MGAAEGVVGDSGRGSVEETARERPPPGPAAEETQSALSLSLQEPGETHPSCVMAVNSHLNNSILLG